MVIVIQCFLTVEKKIFWCAAQGFFFRIDVLLYMYIYT